MRKFELQHGHKVFLIVAGVLFVGAAAGGWFTWKSWESLVDEEDSLRAQIGTARTKIAKVEGLERDVIILRENVQEYVRILPSDAEVNEFYRNIQEFVNVSGARITELNPQPQRGKVKASTAFSRAEYKLRLDATFSEFLHFLNRIENHERFVSIDEIRIKAGEKDFEEPDAPDPAHDIQLTVVTYVYNGNEIGQGVQIPSYENKKIQLLEQIAEARHDLTLERFQLLADGMRRDPLVDPRVLVTDNAVDGVSVEQQESLLTELTGQIEEANALFDLMENAGSVMREMELRVEALSLMGEIQSRTEDAVTRGLVSAPHLKRKLEMEVMPSLAQLKRRAGQLGENYRPDEELVRRQGALAQMAEAFEQSDYQKVVDTFEVFASVSAARHDPELQQIQSQMESLYLVASTALDFMELDIAVSGLVMYPEKNGLNESVAIVNDMVYREGEAIADDLFLAEINEDHLVFEYRGVPLTFDY